MKKLFPISLALVLVLFACENDEVASLPDGALVINELMPSNSTTAADEMGEYDDWVEIYNTTSSEIDLSGFYLSDNADEPTKFKFAEGTTVAAKGYLIVWCDDDAEQGDLHTSFKLSASGEEVLLSDADENQLDYVSFGEQTEELSYARQPNGTGSFAWGTATFKAAN